MLVSLMLFSFYLFWFRYCFSVIYSIDIENMDMDRHESMGSNMVM